MIAVSDIKKLPPFRRQHILSYPGQCKAQPSPALSARQGFSPYNKTGWLPY
ncbi:hypothetical protein SUBVAR_05943 [Subdoligranulum variabile DSM 15176]|uniref:Uncharacterized protein n=1 Tax=Subdoligranulum variabile DSM 15176 TaxID=411471 RepID=D1PNM3_9FIRM|nr:hypothetical protein SUBVAR_05943 [Subdoligranulum variabile DSM 15176]